MGPRRLRGLEWEAEKAEVLSWLLSSPRSGGWFWQAICYCLEYFGQKVSFILAGYISVWDGENPCASGLVGCGVESPSFLTPGSLLVLAL